ncbi:DUF4209 domain-containing protein [Burkholderia sp. ISTR5]|uniref:DUF4209 domain-containing protein n=1 Tax=Burkholderia sp. ISTR5 TaxID=2500161 RepID=UPI001371A7EE|nr:DUF4209 domain-containing protein [Burkholderia sp. ISTR5]NBI49611.1 hypothetical protein [Burkholderia sp. ISTR5]
MEQQSEKAHESSLRASLSDFKTIEWAALLVALPQADSYSMEMALEAEARNATDSGEYGAARALSILVALCAFHLRVEDPAVPFGPKFTSVNRRSYIPSDFRGKQNDTLSSIIPYIKHAGLRARVADVVWFNDRKKWKAGNDAVKAYCEIVEKRVSGTFVSAFDGINETIIDAVDFFHRATQIASMLGKRGKLPAVIQATFDSIFSNAVGGKHYVAFERLARLGASYGIVEWKTVALTSEKLAGAAPDTMLPWAIQPVWNVAADAFDRLGDSDGRRRCVGRSVDQTLKMREQVSTAAARAYWTRKAIAELRQVGGFRERVAALRVELREYQDLVVEETVQFSIPVDLKVEQKNATKLFGNLSLSDALLQLGVFATSPPVSELKEQAERTRAAGLFSSMFGSTYMDREGKVVAQTSARSYSGELTESQFKEECVRILDMRWHYLVGGFVEPAKRTMMRRFPLEERHFRPIVASSPFIPQGHQHIFSLGFSRFWQGDYTSAVHLLIPQLENSIRHVLLNSKLDSSKMSPELLQEDRSLSGLLDSFRSEMNAIFGEDRTHEMELLFVHKPGPALRHELAHGKMSAGACYESNAIYACWFVYHLTVIPLVDHWNDLVASVIESSSF